MSKAKAPRVFVPLTKVDEEQRLVYGTITQQILDKSGEMMDYTLSKPHFEKWSSDIHTASGGLSKGNLRVMHGLSVAGKLTELDFNDSDQSIEVCSKVVDENEWQKVLEGCYTGFSVGGKYGKKWNETIDGEVIKKYEAIPNEVSLVDNPCVPSATFSLVKADGAEEQVMFKAADQADHGDENPEQSEEPTPEDKTPENVPDSDEPHPGSDVSKKVAYEPSNTEVAQKAEELAKTAGDGTTWMQHVEGAREELIKLNGAKKDDDSGDEKKGKGKKDADKKAASKSAEEDSDDKTTKVTPPGVKQLWNTSDGKAFEKKEEAVAHENSLNKAEPTEAEKLAARLKKAVDPDAGEDDQADLFSDLERMNEVVKVLSTPFGEDGEPKLEKGMYTVNRFSNVLSDMASVARCIKAEGAREGEDKTDSAVSAELMDAVKSLGKSFITYASDQVTELLAGLDDEVVVSYHDYYYNAAQADPENGLAKDVCATINEYRDQATERRETLIKSFGIVLGSEEETEEELSPPMQKRFDQLSKDLEDMTKVATDAISSVETLTKRIEKVEDTPLPRAPGSFTAFKDGDNFFGKRADSHEDRVAILEELLKTNTPDQLATMMIKAAHASGGQQLQLAR